MVYTPPTTVPYLTSDTLIESVQRKISVPLSQNTFTMSDVLSFANEEMFIAQVPGILSYHSEYFTTYVTVPIYTNVSRYPIPTRAIGQKLRDVFWQDTSGNIFEMTQVEEHDRAFYQRNIGTNQAIHKFYVEGNDIVLTPGLIVNPTGVLIMVFYLRPNQLVKNDRAAIIQNFQQTITINNTLVNPLDIVTIGVDANPAGSGFVNIPFTAVNTLGGTISSIAFNSADSTLITTSSPHQLSSYQSVVITGSNSNPIVDGTWPVTVLSPTTFTIPIEIATAGTSGSFTCLNQFQIGATGTITAMNLATAITSTNILMGATSISNVVTLSYINIYTNITCPNTTGFIIPQTFYDNQISYTSTIGIVFNALPSTYTDQETNVTSSLFVPNALIDFLQTNPGHKTYVYDKIIPPNGISGNVLTIPQFMLKVPTGTVNTIQSEGIQYMLAPLIPGDYICLANECIIPQIPPDLHNGLAERTSARILAALGDQAGLQASNAKIQEIETRQGNLMANRSDGNPLKVTARKSLLKMGQLGRFRRM